jgi:hypothetical protein
MVLEEIASYPGKPIILIIISMDRYFLLPCWLVLFFDLEYEGYMFL